MAAVGLSPAAVFTAYAPNNGLEVIIKRLNSSTLSQ